MGLSDSEKDYGRQEELNEFDTPVSGSYCVVGTAVRRVTTNSGSKKVRMTVHALKGVEPKEAQKYEGKKFGLDLWWNFDKRYNEQKLAFLIRACHKGEIPSKFIDVDTDKFVDTDENLVEALTGVPFGIKIEVTERTYKRNDGTQGKGADIRILESKDLNDKWLSRFTSDPDFKKLIGKPADRLLDEVVPDSATETAREADSGGSDDDSWADDPDDDLPF